MVGVQRMLVDISLSNFHRGGRMMTPDAKRKYLIGLLNLKISIEVRKLIYSALVLYLNGVKQEKEGNFGIK